MAILLEIENLFKITNRGVFVGLRLIDPDLNFYITEKSFLGGVELAKFLEIPRSIDSNGNQRRDIVVFQLKNQDDAGKLIQGSIVELVNGDRI